MPEGKDEDKEEKTQGRASKVADALADTNDAVGSIVTKATSSLIRGTGKLIDESVKGTSKGIKEGKTPLGKLGKGVVEGTKGTIKGTAEGAREVAKGMGQIVDDIGKGLSKTGQSMKDEEEEDG